MVEDYSQRYENCFFGTHNLIRKEPAAMFCEYYECDDSHDDPKKDHDDTEHVQRTCRSVEG